jgi:RNA polymerase sigma-70 factor, ECF subfamily
MSHASCTVTQAGGRRHAASPREQQARTPRLHVLDPEALHRHTDRLYRAAWALCGSRHDAEDLVQETFLNVLKRPRLLRDGNEVGYLLRALRNTYSSRYRRAAHRRRDRMLVEDQAAASRDDGLDAHEIMEAIASAPAAYRDAVVAVDLVGLSYREAANMLRTRESTITTRLHRGRRYVARALNGELPPTARGSSSTRSSGDWGSWT